MIKETETDLATWHFQFTEGGLAKSDAIDSIAEDCKLFRAPTIIFDQNQFVASDKDSIKITYNAREALKFIHYDTRQQHYCSPADKTRINTISYIPTKLYVKHA